jgi:hypothetical protein
MVRRLLTITLVVATLAGATAATALTSTASRTTIAVVKCPTLYGLPRAQYKIPGVPQKLSAAVAPGAAERLSFYSNGWLSVLAPRGWHCTGIAAATGALDLDVLPPSVAEKPGLSDPHADAITARIPSPDTGEIGGQVCPFFPRATPAPDSRCRSIPAGETIARLSATAVAFQDPPHVVGNGDPSGGSDPANGVALYKESRAAQATCTLPQAEHATCTTILNDFMARHSL